MTSRAESETRSKISELVDKFSKERSRDQSEADVRAGYIDLLFFALGWNVYNDPNSATNYRREGYIRGAGYVDVGLEIRGEPGLFLEAKRFGRIPSSGERIGDRTTEEKQAFRYARGKKIPYVILTNFERLHLFNADHERLIFAFDHPQEYLDNFQDLWRLSPREVEQGRLPWWEGQLEKKDIDDEFLTALRRWRLSLANAIYQLNTDNAALQEDGEFKLDLLMAAVQRILDRLILVRYGDDKEVLLAHDLLENMLTDYRNRGAYAHSDHLMRTFLELSHMMDEHHNTTLFAPGHVCEAVRASNEVLAQIIEEMNAISFRKFTADVLGSTYESYLGTKLVLRDGKVVDEERRDIRKGQGIFYTPRWVVEHIVDNTLGKRLRELEEEHGLHAVEKVRGLAVLDPACGSGSFLIYAYQVLADFYRRLNQAVAEEQARLVTKATQLQMFETLDELRHMPQLVLDYPEVILKEHLYGVDMDSEAAEIAAVNLTMQAFADSRQRKLPRILNENIKVGNSLISSGEKRIRPFDWGKEFPEVMKPGKFDIVIGNPPWASFSGREKKSIPDEERDYLASTYSSFRGWPALHSCFVERAISLLKQGGSLGFILPAQVGSLGSYEPLRKVIIEACDLRDVFYAGEHVFGDVVSPALIIVAVKGSSPQNIVEIRRRPGEVERLPQDVIAKAPGKPFLGFDGLPGVNWDDCFTLGEAVKDSGVHTGNVRARLLSRDLDPEHSEPILQGRDIVRFFVRQPTLYLAKNYQARENEYFSIKAPIVYRVPKLVLRQTAADLIAAIDLEGKYFLNSLLAVYPIEGYSPLYILGLLNSRMLRFYYKKRFQETDQRTFPQVKVGYLRQLPIRRIDFDNLGDKELHDRLVALVTRMLELHQRLAEPGTLADAEREALQREAQETDSAIDELVYDLYGVTAAERRVVEESVSVH